MLPDPFAEFAESIYIDDISGDGSTGFIAPPQGMIAPQPIMLDMNRIAAAFYQIGF